MTGLPETIAAIATAPGAAGVGIIRVSGPKALDIGRTLLGRSEVLETLRMTYGRLRDPRDGRTLDEGFVCAMPAPRSFTGEDIVELQVHGGVRNLARILGVVCACGARHAEPGEFTRRAVLNGRMDLTRAEALLDIIEAPSEAALELAHEQRQGRVAMAVQAISEELDGVLARVEADLDFPDEAETGVDERETSEAITAIADRVEGLAATYDTGRVLREGFRVGLVGLPNAGKSTLFNALLGEERAIVTDLPGTTRDFIEERCELGGLPIVLVDTAGVSEGNDIAEMEGVRRAWSQIETADLVLLLLDGSCAGDAEGERLRSRLSAGNLMVVHTKSDLTTRRGVIDDGVLRVSARTGEGMEELVRSIERRVLPGGRAAPRSALISRARQKEALVLCAEALQRAQREGRSGTPLELVAADLRIARRALAELVGVLTPDELLDRVFGEFCIGK